MLLKVTELQNINSDSPAQWQGRDSHENPIYVRYRGGCLTIAVGKRGDSVFSAVYGEEVFCTKLGDESSGTLSFDELKAATAGVIEWPEHR